MKGKGGVQFARSFINVCDTWDGIDYLTGFHIRKAPIQISLLS